MLLFTIATPVARLSPRLSLSLFVRELGLKRLKRLVLRFLLLDVAASLLLALLPVPLLLLRFAILLTQTQTQTQTDAQTTIVQEREREKSEREGERESERIKKKIRKRREEKGPKHLTPHVLMSVETTNDVFRNMGGGGGGV